MMPVCSGLIRQIIKRRCLYVLCCVLPACSSTQVSSSYDKQTDFNKYRSFDFIADATSLPSDSTYRRLLIEAATDQLQSRGLSRSDHPDLFVDVKLLFQEVNKSVPVEGKTYLYNPTMYIRSEPTFETKRYKVATIFIRILESGKKQMIWQGQGSGTISVEQKKFDIHHAVARIVKKYPVDVKRN